jgi:hypothetical protein
LLKEELKVKNEGYKENLFKWNTLETIENIYSKLKIDQMKIVNLAGSGKNGQMDVAGQLMA